MKAIDVHAHISTKEWYETTRKYHEALEKNYGYKFQIKTPAEMAQDFRDADVKALIIAWDAEAGTGHPKIPNDVVARFAEEYPDVFLGAWACVDPWKQKSALDEVERAIKGLGMIGVKFQQAAQEFFPNDRRVYPIYEKCVELGCPVQFHTGTTGLGGGMPGGMGVHLKYTKPIPYIDDVAADFPDLKIIACHPSWPWQEEMIAIVVHKANVFMELSGWLPKYFPESLKREVKGRLQDRVMFGSDYPLLSHKRLLEDWESEGYKPEILEKVFYKNAQRILGLKV